MSEDLILEIKPKFIDYIRMLSLDNIAMSVAIASFSIFTGFLTVFLLANINEQALNSFFNLILCFAVNYVVLFLITLKIRVYIDKKNFEVTNYKVYQDRLEFEEGFINHKHTVLKLADIKEIHLTQNFIQRREELGTIKFVTAANNSYPMIGIEMSGIAFKDIENSLAVYTKIKQLHENK